MNLIIYKMESSSTSARAHFQTELANFLQGQLNIQQPALGHISQVILKEHQKQIESQNLDDLNDFAKIYLSSKK